MINERDFYSAYAKADFIPFDVISYGSGLTSIRYKDFLLATSLNNAGNICICKYWSAIG